MIRRFFQRSFPVLLLTAGCATYRPDALRTGPDALDRETAAIVVKDAAGFRRPFLTPTTIALDQPLDANAVATIAVMANPDLKALRARAGINDAQVFDAGLLPDPTFSAGIDHLLSGPDPVDNLVGALGLDINALRTRKVVREKAAAEARQVRLDLAWSEWQTAGQARIQVARVLGLERSLVLARASAGTAAASLDRTLRAVGRGDLAADQAQAARTDAFDAADKVRTGEKDLATAQSELRRLMGLAPDFPLRLARPDQTGGAIPDAAALFATATASRADLQALQAGYAAQEAATHKAVLDQFPNLTLTINGARDTGRNVLLGPAIDFTLPLWNRNRGGIAIENATRGALKAEYEARLFQTRSEIAAAAAAIAIARRQRDAVVRDLPAAEKMATASRRAADRGDLAEEAANTAEQALRDKQMVLAQSEQDEAEQMIALELLTGSPREAWTR